MALWTDPNSFSGRMWRAAASNFFQSDCKFSELSVVSISARSLVISELHHMLNPSVSADTRSSCLAALLAVAVQQTLSSYVYLSMKPKIFNYYGVQSDQTGSVSGGYPYQKLGLDGTGQIVGLCDSGVDLNSCFYKESSGPSVSFHFLLFVFE
jgi:hypothetical protein